jgi:hypothetical protein
MPSRRTAALGLRAALTLSCAVLVHGALHAAGDRSFVLDSPAHVAMFAAALALLSLAALPLRLFGPSRERRRRLALLRAALPRNPRVEAATAVVTQAALAPALLAADGAVLAPDRLVLAVACGLVALAFSALVFAGSTCPAVALLVALFTARERDDAPLAPARRPPLPVRLCADFHLFVPNRPPPIAA